MILRNTKRRDRGGESTYGVRPVDAERTGVGNSKGTHEKRTRKGLVLPMAASARLTVYFSVKQVRSNHSSFLASIQQKTTIETFQPPRVHTGTLSDTTGVSASGSHGRRRQTQASSPFAPSGHVGSHHLADVQTVDFGQIFPYFWLVHGRRDAEHGLIGRGLGRRTDQGHKKRGKVDTERHLRKRKGNS